MDDGVYVNAEVMAQGVTSIDHIDSPPSEIISEALRGRLLLSREIWGSLI